MIYLNIFFSLDSLKIVRNQFGDFFDLGPDWIRIRIHKIFWIRNRTQSMRIHITAIKNVSRICTYRIIQLCNT